MGGPGIGCHGGTGGTAGRILQGGIPDHHHPHRRAHGRAVDAQACALRLLAAAAAFQQHGAGLILGHDLRLKLRRGQRRVLLLRGGEDIRQREHLGGLAARGIRVSIGQSCRFQV